MEIERSFRDGVALRDIATSVNMSPAHLTDTIRRTTGRPIQQWIIERRLSEARRLLVETDETIHRIAFACGFTDPAYFTRAFRARLHVAPERWRRAARAAGIAGAAAWNRRSLLAMAERIALADDRDAIEAAAAASAVSALGMDYAHSARRDPSTRIWMTFPLAPHIAPLCFSDDSEYMPSVAIGCTFVQDALSTSRFTHGRNISAAIGFETFIVVPLFVDGLCVGGTAAFARRSRVLSADEIEVAETIAACAALRLAELPRT
jgi:AraC-like DNA-binding protein